MFDTASSEATPLQHSVFIGIQRDPAGSKLRWRAYVRKRQDSPYVLASSLQQGSLVSAMESVDNLFGPLDWVRPTDDSPLLVRENERIYAYANFCYPRNPLDVLFPEQLVEFLDENTFTSRKVRFRGSPLLMLQHLAREGEEISFSSEEQKAIQYSLKAFIYPSTLRCWRTPNDKVVLLACGYLDRKLLIELRGSVLAHLDSLAANEAISPEEKARVGDIAVQIGRIDFISRFAVGANVGHLRILDSHDMLDALLPLGIAERICSESIEDLAFPSPVEQDRESTTKRK